MAWRQQPQRRKLHPKNEEEPPAKISLLETVGGRNEKKSIARVTRSRYSEWMQLFKVWHEVRAAGSAVHSGCSNGSMSLHCSEMYNVSKGGCCCMITKNQEDGIRWNWIICSNAANWWRVKWYKLLQVFFSECVVLLFSYCEKINKKITKYFHWLMDFVFSINSWNTQNRGELIFRKVWLLF